MSTEQCAKVLRSFPRLALAVEFGAALRGQAGRKVGCAAASFIEGGGVARLGSKPLGAMG